MTPAECPNCSTVPEPGHLFCEKCGFDFITSTPPANPTSIEVHAVEVSVDRAHHRFMDPDGQLEMPDPAPEPSLVTLAPASLIGRRSESRAVYPEVDVGELTGDPAVSARQAMLRRRDDGAWVVSDLSSTNGTYLRRPSNSPGGDPGGDPEMPEPEMLEPEMLDPGIEVELDTESTILVGAWTAIRLRP